MSSIPTSPAGIAYDPANPKTGARVPRQPGSIDDRGGNRLAEIATGKPTTTVVNDQPYWMTYPERPWCTGGHVLTDLIEDRDCVHDFLELPLTLHDPVRYVCPTVVLADPAILHVEVRQAPGEISPRVLFNMKLGRDIVGAKGTNGSVTHSLTFAIEETQEVASKLVALADAGDASPPEGPVPADAPYWLTTPCPAWCAEFHLVDSHPGDRRHEMSKDETDMITVALRLEKARSHDSAPMYVELSLSQHYRSTTPVIAMDRACDPGIELTTAEARTLAARLVQLPAFVAGEVA